MTWPRAFLEKLGKNKVLVLVNDYCYYVSMIKNKNVGDNTQLNNLHVPLLLDTSKGFHSMQIITILGQNILTAILFSKSKQWKNSTTEKSSTTFSVARKSGPLYCEQISQICVENILNTESFHLFKILRFNITHLLWTKFHLSNLGADF